VLLMFILERAQREEKCTEKGVRKRKIEREREREKEREREMQFIDTRKSFRSYGERNDTRYEYR